MGADMIARSLYLRAGTEFNTAAAKAVASQLTRQAGIDELPTLITEGWVGKYNATDLIDLADDAAATDQLRQLAEQSLHQLLDTVAGSLTWRQVFSHHLDSGDEPGIDVYTTGGLSWGDSPTDAFSPWDVLFDEDRLPDGWATRMGAAAGLLRPYGDGPAVATVTFRAWGRPG